MTSAIDNGDFWLPPEFLTDDDILMDFKPKTHNAEVDSFLHFPFDYSTGFNAFNPHSGLSSPVESMLSSESEEEDYLAGLTRKMANSTLLDDLWKSETHKSWGISVSPQSTLCGCKQGSSRNSPNCPSPPLPAAADRKDASWDVLYAAAGEVARMRMIEEATPYYQSRGLNHISTKMEDRPSLGFRSNQPLSYQQLQIAKFQQLRREQLLKQLQAAEQTHHVAARARTGDRRPANLSPVAWPTLQQSLQPPPQQPPVPAGSGMRAVFLGNAGPKRECAGTGVFLPRRPGSAAEPSRKSGSTVLLPDRVVQALNLNLEPMDMGGAVNVRNSVYSGHQQKSHLRAPPAAPYTELRLPQEWTY